MDANGVNLEKLGITPLYTIWWTSFWRTGGGYLTISLIMALLVFFAFLIIYWLRCRRRTPEAVIKAALAQLAQEKPETTQHSRERYDRLTAVIKTYLFARMAIPRGLTDRQLMKRLSTELEDKDQVESLRGIIDNAELAKFARMPIVEKLIKADITRVQGFVAYITRSIEFRKQHGS